MERIKEAEVSEVRDDISIKELGDGKYMALKEPKSAHDREHIEDLWLAPGSFFILRATDAFAIPTLYAYAAAIQTHVELNRKTLPEAKQTELMETADYAFGLAQDWKRRGEGRLPD